MGEDIFNTYKPIAEKGLVSRIYKEYLKISKKFNLKMGKRYRQFTEEINKHMKRCSNKPWDLL